MYTLSTSKRDQYHHGQLRQTLLALARTALEAESADALSLRALAQAAGVSPMAPYRHFPEKAALLTALAEEGFTELRARFGECDRPDDPRRAIGAFAAAYVRFAIDHPALFRLMYGAAPPTPSVGQEDDQQTVIGLLTARLAQIVGPERASRALLAGWAAIHGLAMLITGGRIRTPVADPEMLARDVAAIFLRGIEAG